MKHKLKAIMLAMISAIFVFGANAQADTISVVSDTAYAPFEFKDSDQVYKGIDVDIINEVILPFDQEIIDERFVDLDDVYRNEGEIAECGVSCSKVVHQQPDPHRPEFI